MEKEQEGMTLGGGKREEGGTAGGARGDVREEREEERLGEVAASTWE